MRDAEARRRIREDLDASFVVEAAAGTGKTTELIARIVAVIGRGRARLEAIVAVTFTEMAAGEMKLRLRTELDEARARAHDDAERARYEAALAALETARISTIHGLCSDLLRERPIEAGIDPAFSVLAEGEATRLFERAFDAWFARALAEPTPTIRRVLARLRGEARASLFRAAFDLADRRDFDAPWDRPAFDRDARIDALVVEIAAVGDASRHARGRDAVVDHLERLATFAANLADREIYRGRDHERLEAELVALADDRVWNRRGTKRLFSPDVDGDAVLDRREALGASLTAFVTDANEDLAAALPRELAQVVAAYDALRRKAGALDFLDLLLRTRDLLRDDAGVRRAFQARFSHLFVDEFQDTDPLQAEIVLLLASADGDEDDPARVRPAPGKLFVVGDPKQAIYRFRRADVALYARIKAQLCAAGAVELHLTTSFRGRPALQSLVNGAYAPLMQGAEDGSQARYVPLSPHRPDDATKPAVIALPVPDPYGARGTVTKGAVEASIPDAVGAFVKWLVDESGWQVEERGAPVPVAARHVCLLFSRMRGWGGADVTRPYARALEARRIPHVLVGGRSLFQREEVMALRAAIGAIEWPDDALSVYATLRGPFFSFSDDVLLAYHDAQGGGASVARSLNPLRRPREPLADEAFEAVRGVLALLAKLHAGRNRRPIADTLGRLLDAARAHAGLAIWPNGEQALANVLCIVEEARRFDRRATSFRAFAEWLDAQAERQQSGDAPVVEEGTDGIRMMTVHKAKGLEFPVVILCNPTAPRATARPSRFIEGRRWVAPICGLVPRELRERDALVRAHDDAERVRLGYVAATRARDVLVVPCVGDERVDGWVAPLHPGLYPALRAEPIARAAPGCPPFGTETVRRRHLHVTVSPEDSVVPGLHRPRVGDHSVVWWSPDALTLDVAGAGGLRQMELLITEGHGETAASGRADHDRWRAARDEALAAGAESRLGAVTVTAHAQATAPAATARPAERSVAIVTLAPADDPSPAEATGTTSAHAVGAVSREIGAANREIGAGRERPHGPRFGSLVHAVLAEIAFDADRAAIDRLARAQARLLDAPEAEASAAGALVASALASPLLRRAAKSPDCRREIPVSMPLEDGRLLEGIVDLAFLEDDRFVVVDYKTDRGALSDHYLAQVALYAEVIAAATGKPTEPLLLKL